MKLQIEVQDIINEGTLYEKFKNLKVQANKKKMSWTVIILIIIGVIIIKFLIDKEKMLTEQVDKYGGMLKKYDEIIGPFKNFSSL